MTKLIFRASLLFFFASFFAGCQKSVNELRVYTWTDYIAPELIVRFEEEHHCRVILTTYESNESMLESLQYGEVQYDVIMPSSYLIKKLVDEQLIVKLDHSKLQNVRANFDTRFTSQILDSTFTYAVPYAVTYTGLLYRKGHTPDGAAPETWRVYGNPKMRGRMTLLNDIRESMAVALIVNGFSASSRNPKEIERAGETLLSWKKNIQSFNAEPRKTDMSFDPVWICHGYSTDAAQLILGSEEDNILPHEDIGFALPKEGFIIAFDEMAIPAHAPNPTLAYAFINFLYEAENAKHNMMYLKGPMPVRPGIEALDENFRQQIILPEKTIKRGQLLQPLDEATHAKYEEAWSRLTNEN